MQGTGLDPAQIPPWTTAAPPSPARGRLVSLALRPAPVTDQWLTEGPELGPDLHTATQRLTLLEAPDPRHEALAIAVALRRALEEDKTAALITPDRALARRVAGALDHWGLLPDDSAGRPLALTAPGIYLRRLARTLTTLPGPVDFLALLRHPLTASGARGRHLALTSAFEIEVLRRGAPVLSMERLITWASEAEAPDAVPWAEWLTQVFAPLTVLSSSPRPLADWIAAHRAAAERLSAGPDGKGTALWDKAEGEAAARVMDQLAASADAGGAMDARDYANLLETVLQGIDVTDPGYKPDPGLSIWGTLEARTQVADLVVLGGLNEGTWPRLPRPDPWLSREMRLEAGLTLPERQIGLSAHDFQQAMGGAEVILTRARRGSDGDPAVPARWLLRIENLMAGIGDEGAAALEAMRARGDDLLRLAKTLEQPPTDIRSAPRPAPRPPVAARPTELPVTTIETLIRDPYSVYARHILGLRRLHPPGRDPDHLERGDTVHKVLERFIKDTMAGLPPDAAPLFDRIAAEVLQAEAPWPARRRLWLARLLAFRDEFLAGEADRRAEATPLATEARGRRTFDGLAQPFTLTARADRIDRAGAALRIYDYKGSAPGKSEVAKFAKQLPLTALIAMEGGFEGIAAGPVDRMELIETKPGGKRTPIDATPDYHRKTEDEFRQLLAAYQRAEMPYAARLKPKFIKFEGDYDHLARRGEWLDGDPPDVEDVE